MARLRPRVQPYRRWWDAAAPRERAIGVAVFLVVAFLLGAFLFGAWHVVVGGFVRGNWRAAVFGLALAAVTGLLIGVGHVTVGQRFRR